MQMLPGSQVDGIAPQCDFWDTNNLSTTVQTIDANVDKSREVQATLQSCEVSFHHIDICHASKPNETNDWRVVWALRHITPADRQKRVDTDFATLLKGEDYCG